MLCFTEWATFDELTLDREFIMKWMFYLPFSFLFVCSDLALESNPSDHARASTIFLSKSQTDGESIAEQFHLILLQHLMNENFGLIC